MVLLANGTDHKYARYQIEFQISVPSIPGDIQEVRHEKVWLGRAKYSGATVTGHQFSFIGIFYQINGNGYLTASAAAVF